MTFQNEREFFRLPVDKPCSFKLTAINGKPIGTDKMGSGKIVNISAGGLLLETALFFPPEIEIRLEITFELDQETFCIEGKIVRIDEPAPLYLYGIGFLKMPEHKQALLVSTLAKLQIAKVRVK
ncbi:MAG: PilZ domain-containing protein [Bacillota bacterium]